MFQIIMQLLLSLWPQLSVTRQDVSYILLQVTRSIVDYVQRLRFIIMNKVSIWYMSNVAHLTSPQIEAL